VWVGLRAARGAARGGGGGASVSGKVGRQEPEAGLRGQLSHFPTHLLTAAGLKTQSQAHDMARLQATGGAPGQQSSGRSVLASWLVPWCCAFVGPVATLGMQALHTALDSLHHNCSAAGHLYREKDLQLAPNFCEANPDTVQSRQHAHAGNALAGLAISNG
jgi:hypothetical protein